MRIAVTSKGKSRESEVDERFGRARFFVIYDTDTGLYEAVDNSQNLNAPQGAGVQAANIVSSQDANVLLTGHCGPKAFRGLQAAGIEVVTGVGGTVEEAVGNYKDGKYKSSGAPDVEGHW
jgi:predicted Fe-Mo cluster-binding NifX family protein